MKKFTLIELLVVIAIIGILVSILLPSLHKSREITLKAACMNNQKQIYLGMMAYSLDNNEYIATGDHTANGRSPQYYRNWFALWDLDKATYKCPSTASDETSVNYEIDKDYPDSSTRETWTVSYTMQEHVMDNRHGIAKLTVLDQERIDDKFWGVLLTDGFYRVNAWGNFGSEQLSGGRARFRHMGQANFLRVDGKVKALKESFVFGLAAQGDRSVLPSHLD